MASSHDIPDTVAAVLAGGENRRMNGQPKLLLPLAGQPILQYQLECLQHPSVHSIVINSNLPLPSPFADLPRIVDADFPGTGPLSGVLNCLDWMAVETHALWLLTTPGDTPFLPGDYVQRLLTTIANDPTGRQCFYVRSADYDYYLCAAWHLDCRQPIRQYLEQGRRSVRHLLADLDAGIIPMEPEQMAETGFSKEFLFFNINTPEEYQQAIDALITTGKP